MKGRAMLALCHLALMCHVAWGAEDGFLALCRRGDAERISAALAAGASPDTRNEGGSTALMIAAANAGPDAVLALLGAGADVGATNDQGTTALMLAAHWNGPEVVALLLDAGADPSPVDELGRTAADWGAGNAKLEGTTALARLEGRPVVAPPDPSPTPEPEPDPVVVPTPDPVVVPEPEPVVVPEPDPVVVPEPEPAPVRVEVDLGGVPRAVRGDGVGMHVEPDAGSSLVAILGDGLPVEALKRDVETSWALVRTRDGTEGWIPPNALRQRRDGDPE